VFHAIESNPLPSADPAAFLHGGWAGQRSDHSAGAAQ
jgi:hypothetical protein